MIRITSENGKLEAALVKSPKTIREQVEEKLAAAKAEADNLWDECMAADAALKPFKDAADNAASAWCAKNREKESLERLLQFDL